MDRSVVSASVVATFALVGCTQDFGTFDPAGSGGGTPTSSTASAPTSSTTGASTGQGSTGSGEGGAAASTGAGGGTGGATTTCDVPADCDDGNPCTEDRCVDSTCDHTALEDQVLIDSADDCRTIECVGGVYVDEPADEDPGDTNPPCEETICEGGVPTPVFASDTTACGDPPAHCDGAGVCVGCDPGGPSGDECGAETDCAAPECVESGDDGVCDPGYFPDTTDLDDDVDGNCQKPACTGSSAAPISVADDTDEPDDLPCGNRSCTGGAPSTVIVAEGMPCLVGTGVCDGADTAAANCKTCIDDELGAAEDSGCDTDTPVCNPAGAGTCVVCYLDGQTSVGCAAGATCDPDAAGGDGACIECDGDEDCTDQVCDLDINSCEDCASNGGDGSDDGCGNALDPRCDETDRTCKGCSGSGDCTDNVRGHICRGDNQCGCQNTPDCPGDLTCPGGGGVCE